MNVFLSFSVYEFMTLCATKVFCSYFKDTHQSIMRLYFENASNFA